MATDRNDVIIKIDVKYEDAIKGMAFYKKGIDEVLESNKKLKDALKEGKISQDDYNKSIAANKVIQDGAKESIRALEKEIKNNIKTEKEQEGSLSSLRAQLSNATKEYDNMSKAERSSAKGNELSKHINDIIQEITEAEEATGRFQRNVGNYKTAMENAIASTGIFGKTMVIVSNAGKSAGGVIGMLKSQIKSFTAALLANPILAIIAAVVVVFTAFKKAIDSSEEATARWNAILAPLGRALQAVLNVLQAVVGWLLEGIEGFIGLAMAGAKLLEKLPLVGKYFAEANSETEKSIKLEQAKYALEKQTRETLVANAKNERDIAKLRTEANDKANFSAEERLEKIQQANALEKENADRNLAIAQEKLRIAEVEASYSENTKETEAGLAQLRSDVYKAETDHFNKIRELGEKENTFRAEITANEKQSSDEAKERRSKELDAMRQAEDAATALIKDEIEKRRAEITTSYARQIADLKQKLATEGNLSQKAREAINQTILALEKKQTQDLDALSDESIEKEAAKQARILEVRLAAIKSGSTQELQLKLEQLQLQHEAEIRAAEETGVAVVDINAKYDKMVADTRKESAEQVHQQLAEQTSLEWENKFMEAESKSQETLIKRQAEINAMQQLEGESDTQYKARKKEAQEAFDQAEAEARSNNLQLQLEQRKAELDSIQQLEGESDAEYKNRQLEAKILYNEALGAIEDDKATKDEERIAKEKEIEEQKKEALSGVKDATFALMDELGEKNKGFAIASKVLALGEIMINQGKAIAGGIASAMSTPFPGNIAAIATTITAIMTGVTSAIKTVKSVKFAEGGLVAGPGSGTSDSIPAHLSNGESVMTARATSMFSPLLSAFNQMGGGIPITTAQTASNIMGEDMLANAVARGVATLPRPVVSVQEINSVDSRVSVYETGIVQ